jgi:hypothetical protein
MAIPQSAQKWSGMGRASNAEKQPTGRGPGGWSATARSKRKSGLQLGDWEPEAAQALNSVKLLK